jgi:hypothetical protein
MEIRCPGCGHAHHASEDLVRKNAGKTARCQRCGKSMPLPRAEELSRVGDDDVLAMMQEAPPILHPPPSSQPDVETPAMTFRAPLQESAPNLKPLSYGTRQSGFKLRAPMGGTWQDFFAFRSMLMTRVIQVIFVLGAIGIILAGIVMMFRGFGSNEPITDVTVGLLTILFGPLVIRLYCEIAVVLFRLNDTLTEVRDHLQNSSR